MTKIDIESQTVVHDYGNVCDDASSLAVSWDNQSVFVGGYDKMLRQYGVESHELTECWPLVSYITAAVGSVDSKYVFCGYMDGHLLQIPLASEEDPVKYGEVHSCDIWTMAVTKDNQFLITGGQDGVLKAISIRTQTVVQDFGQMCPASICTLQLSLDGEKLWMLDYNCNLKLIEIEEGKVLEDFGKVAPGFATGKMSLLVTSDGESIFASNWYTDKGCA